MIKNLKYLTTAVVVFAMSSITFAQAPNLGAAGNFVLFTTTGAVTNTGISQFTGDIGTNNGAISGFGNVNGNMQTANGATAAAAADLTLAYNQLDATAANFFPGILLGNGTTFTAGVYESPAATTLSGTLFLDGQNLPNQVFIIRVDGTFASSANAQVVLQNGALACNVFWQVEGMVSLAANTKMRGTIIANNASIDISPGVRLEGRALSTTGAITTNNVLGYIPTGCGSPVLTGPAAPALNSAGCYALFTANGPMTNTGITTVTGDVGTNTGLTTGFNALFVNGMIHPIPDGSTAAAASDLLNAYNNLNALTHDIELLFPAQFGNSLVLTPHTYLLNGATALTDTLYLNAKGNANAVFVIQINGALSTSSLAVVQLMNGAQASNVFWKVEGAVDISGGSKMAGTIIANNGAVSLNTAVDVQGHAFSTNGSFLTDAINAEIPAPCSTIPPMGAVIYKQTFRLGSTNVPDNTVVTPLPEASNEAGSGVTVARENNGRADVLAMSDAGYMAGVGSGSQMRLSAFGTGVNKLGVHSINSGGTPGHFYTAFTVKTALAAGGAFKFLTGTGSNFVNGNQLPTAAQTATSLIIFRHPTAGDYRFGFTDGTSATTVHGTGINWTQANRIEVYANNTASATTYYHCGMAMALPANTQHFYINGTKLTTAVYPTGDFGLSNLPDGTMIDAVNFIANTAGSDARIDDIHYSGDLSNPVMSGNYTVDASESMSTAFPSIAMATKALECRGVSGPVTISFAPGTYSENMMLGEVPGTSATSTVTLLGTGVTMSGCPSGRALIHVNGADNIIFSNFTLVPTCEKIGFLLEGSTDNVILLSNTVNMLQTALTSKSIGVLVDAPMGSVSLLNNTILNGYVGMWARNTNAPITVDGNQLYNNYAYGILLQSLMADRNPGVVGSGVVVNNNRVRMSSTAHPNAQGVRANYIGGGFMMNSNYINRSPLMAVNLANANQTGSVRAQVINNRMGGDGPSSSGGIGIYNVDNLDFLHNSIVGMTQVRLSENIDVRNNSFVSVDASQYAYLGTPYSNSYVALNNNYYANTSTGGNFVGIETLYQNMTQLQQGYQGVVTYNQNSVGGMGYPYTDSLRITDASPLYNAGIMAGVAVDFENQARPNGASVDIGADEFVSFTPPRLAASSATLDADVYPNPFQNNLTVQLNASEAGAVQVVLSDLMGRQVLSRSYTAEAGARNLQLQVEQQLPQGVYLLQVTQGEATSTFRVVKQ